MTDAVRQHMPQKNSCQKQKKNNGLEIAMVNTNQGKEVGGTSDKGVEDIGLFAMIQELPKDTVEGLRGRRNLGVWSKQACVEQYRNKSLEEFG